MFIPSTPRGELLKLMRDTDSNFRRGTTIKPIKFIERAGVSLTDTLVDSNPWGDRKCGRTDCFICRGEKGGIGQCMKESVLHSIKCEECTTKGSKSIYWGETGRDGYVRGGEHLKGCNEKNDENALWKHIQGEHRGEGKGYEIFMMRVERGYKKPLARQISEGVEIEMCEGNLLNSKAECNNSRIPRIIIEEGESQVEDGESGLSKKSEKVRMEEVRKAESVQIKGKRVPESREITEDR